MEKEIKKIDWNVSYSIDPLECDGCKRLFEFLLGEDNIILCMTCFNSRNGWEETKYEINKMNESAWYQSILWEKPSNEVPKQVADKVPRWRKK